MLDSASPIIKKQKKMKNKENNIDDINPMSERASMISLKKSMKSPLNRNNLPPHSKALKEKSMAHITNLSYCEQSYNDNNYPSKSNLTLKNSHMRDPVS